MQFSRRDLLSGTGSLLVGPIPAQAATSARLHLRLLETSDLHMFAMDWDYYRARVEPTVGLVKVASLIRRARMEAANHLLFDNGDIIQGNPLGDFVAIDGNWPATQVHPMFAAMNTLGYDAATLGNHEFNYGLPFLERALSGAAFPFVCANLRRVDGSEYLPAYRIVERRMRDEEGREHVLRVGVVGFLPPQIMTWDRQHLIGRVATFDIVETAQKIVPALRPRCDVLVALCHSGITPGPIRTGEENAACQLSLVPGIDAIMTGHSHRVFPGPDYHEGGGIDPVNGRLNGVPAVMPGFWGSHLGIIDLMLSHDGERWQVEQAHAEARPIYRRDAGSVISLTTADTGVEAAVATTHERVRAWVDQPVGTLAQPVNSFFVWTGFDPASALVNAAQTTHATKLLANTPYADLPLLSAAAPFKAGYTADSYVDLPAGPVTMRAIADLYIYPNMLTVVRMTGATLHAWLEHAARVFNQIDPRRTDTQALVDRRVPSYNFDVISGVTYEIDVTVPPRTNRDGAVVNPASQRIVNLKFQGAPVDQHAEFALVTNNYRADGGGGFPTDDGKIILRTTDMNRDAVLDYVRTTQEAAAILGSPWRFARSGGVARVSFLSAIGAADRLTTAPGVRRIGPATDGYDLYLLDLP